MLLYKSKRTDTERSPAARLTMAVYPLLMAGLGSSIDSTLTSSQSISSFTWLPFTLKANLCHSPSNNFSTPWKVLNIWLPWGLVQKKSKERLSPWKRRPTCSRPVGSLTCHKSQVLFAVSLVTLNVAMMEQSDGSPSGYTSLLQKGEDNNTLFTEQIKAPGGTLRFQTTN